jgi:LysR family transcriptional regulator, regulator for metE and metH
VDLEVRHLRLITAIADQGSVTGAANNLNLTQSALSHQLRDIEDRLGVPLFQRLAKRMILTQAGERLLESARSVLDELDRTENEIRETLKQRHGVLRISTECYTCYHWLPSRLKVFSAKFPRLEVRIVADATRRPFQALLDGRLDIGIVCTKIRNRRLQYKPLFSDELIAVMNPDHPLAGKSYLNAADFADQHLITYAIPKDELSIFQRLLKPAGVMPRQFSQIELTEAIVEMVKSGMGISTMARWAASPHIQAGTLAGVPLTRHGLRRMWSAAILRNGRTPDHITEFIRLIATKTEADTDVGPYVREYRFGQGDVAYALRNRG